MPSARREEECGTDRRARAAELARLVGRVRGLVRPGASHCPSGLPPLDRALGGGFAVPGVHELIAVPPGAPALSIALRVAAGRALRTEGWIFYVDAEGEFYPPGAARMGVPLDRLIVIAARTALDGLWVCEQALRCPAVAAVVAGLPRVDAHVSRRLQLAAETGGTLGLLVRTEERGGPTFAATRLRVEPLAVGTQVRRVRVCVLKLRDGAPGRPIEVELPDAIDEPSPQERGRDERIPCASVGGERPA